MAERVGKRVEEAGCGHKGVFGGDGEIEESGGCVVLGDRGGGVEEFGNIGDCAGVGDYGSGIRVGFGEEAELGDGVGSGLVGYGA